MNTTLLAPEPLTPRRYQLTRTERPPGQLFHVLAFLLGLAMPLISFAAEGKITHSLLSRIEAVDVICVALVLLLTISGRLRFTWGFAFYFFTLVVSLAIGITTGPGSFTAFAALMMAALYFVVGRSIAEHSSLVKALVAGLAISALLESVIVVHDYFLPKWFPASHDSRVRGTFRSTSQLGEYGLTIAGILLSFGWVYFRSAWAKTLVLFAGVMGLFFVLAATKRAGMFAELVWVGLFLLCGLKHLSRRAYWVVLCATGIALLVISLWSSLLSQTYLFDRFQRAFEQASSGKSFSHQQFDRVMENIPMWFPLGIGVGQSPLVVTRHELHNAHLAVLVELGVLGAIGYYWLWIPSLRRKWEDAFGQHSSMVKLISLTFLAGSLVFMIHGRLNRDRTFMLFLGLLPLISYSTAQVSQTAQRIRRRGPATAFPPGATPRPRG